MATHASLLVSIAVMAGASGCVGLLGDFTVEESAARTGSAPVSDDAGEEEIAPPPDSGARDTGAHDSGTHDAGAHDGGTSDGGAHDSGASDSAIGDSATSDGAIADARAPDTGSPWSGCSGAALAFDDPWTASLGASGSGWTASFGDPYVDIPNNRLRLSYDDIVTRSAPISGSYYV